MTGYELAFYLYLYTDFCDWHCGIYAPAYYGICNVCKYQLGYDMYLLALDMLETA